MLHRPFLDVTIGARPDLLLFFRKLSYASRMHASDPLSTAKLPFIAVMIRQFSPARKKCFYCAQRRLGLPDADGQLVSLGARLGRCWEVGDGVFEWECWAAMGFLSDLDNNGGTGSL